MGLQLRVEGEPKLPGTNVAGVGKTTLTIVTTEMPQISLNSMLSRGFFPFEDGTFKNDIVLLCTQYFC